MEGIVIKNRVNIGFQWLIKPFLGVDEKIEGGDMILLFLCKMMRDVYWKVKSDINFSSYIYYELF